MTSLNALTGEAADRLAVRGLVEASAHCADRCKPQQQAELFVFDRTVTVYQGDPPRASQSSNSVATPNSTKPSRSSITTTRQHTSTSRAPSPLPCRGAADSTPPMAAPQKG